MSMGKTEKLKLVMSVKVYCAKLTYYDFQAISCVKSISTKILQFYFDQPQHSIAKCSYEYGENRETEIGHVG